MKHFVPKYKESELNIFYCELHYLQKIFKYKIREKVLNSIKYVYLIP